MLKSILHPLRFLAVSCLALLITLTSPTLQGTSTASPVHWQTPVSDRLQVLRPFEKPAATWSAGHRGVDLALGAGQSVLAPFEGTVVFAGTVVDRQVLTLEHPDGRRSSFEPITNPLPVGTQVTIGQAIAQLDPDIPHCGSEFCLHWGVRQPPTTDTGDAGQRLDYIDPLLLLGLGEPSVLLPIGDDFSA